MSPASPTSPQPVHILKRGGATSLLAPPQEGIRESVNLCTDEWVVSRDPTCPWLNECGVSPDHSTLIKMMYIYKKWGVTGGDGGGKAITEARAELVACFLSPRSRTSWGAFWKGGSLVRTSLPPCQCSRRLQARPTRLKTGGWSQPGNVAARESFPAGGECSGTQQRSPVCLGGPNTSSHEDKDYPWSWDAGIQSHRTAG